MIDKRYYEKLGGFAYLLDELRKKLGREQTDVLVNDAVTLCKGTDFELPFLLAVWLGLRTSEIRGLTWDCLVGRYPEHYVPPGVISSLHGGKTDDFGSGTSV